MLIYCGKRETVAFTILRTQYMLGTAVPSYYKVTP